MREELKQRGARARAQVQVALHYSRRTVGAAARGKTETILAHLLARADEYGVCQADGGGGTRPGILVVLLVGL